MQSTGMDNIFRIVSRFTIIIPIIVVIAAVLLKFSGGIYEAGKDVNTAVTPTPVKENSFFPTVNLNSSTASAKITLDGPLNCEYKSVSASISAHIANKKILLNITDSSGRKNFLLNGDCAYSWLEGKYSGEKVCGLSSQISIADGLLSSGLIDQQFILSGITQFFKLPQTGDTQSELKSALDSCSNSPIPGYVKFDVPKTILFKNTQSK